MAEELPEQEMPLQLLPIIPSKDFSLSRIPHAHIEHGLMQNRHAVGALTEGSRAGPMPEGVGSAAKMLLLEGDALGQAPAVARDLRRARSRINDAQLSRSEFLRWDIPACQWSCASMTRPSCVCRPDR